MDHVKKGSTGNPNDSGKRILLCLTGMSPQIVTETLYALAVQSDPPWVPDEIHLITTSEGSKIARRALFDPASGHVGELVRDYGLPEIRFEAAFLHVMKDRNDHPLPDIRSGEENEDAADFIVEVVRRLTEDANSSLHVSLAGGRKTMGFYAGYALSLFGRTQDRLSHVLVSSPFESLPDFYYPPPNPVQIHARSPSTETFTTEDAVVTLASIPFVLLRQALPDLLLQRKKPFREAVQAVQSSLPPQTLAIDISKKEILAGNKKINLSPTEFAFFSWFARRKMNGEEPLSCPKDGLPNKVYAKDFLQELQKVLGVMGDSDRTERALRKGMDQNFFEQKRSRLNKKIEMVLGTLATPFLVRGKGARGKSYEVGLKRESISFGPLTTASPNEPTVGVQTVQKSSPPEKSMLFNLHER